MTWRDNFRAVREQPATLERLRLGLIWALCHVHTPVEQAEEEFESYVWGGELPEGTMLPDAKARGIESANAYVMGLDWEWWLDLPAREKVLDVIRHVWGLGAPKASFGLTSAGFINWACFDTHIIDLRFDTPVGRERSSLLNSWRTAGGRATAGLARYVAALERAYGCVDGSGWQQWEDYETIHAGFKADGHAVFFQALGV